ncbi:hypothetical protein EDD17DRAFT_1759095 [Pisolithus thermaeus]|nr:hypothetical protein EDD17DRAFT_1759095 [Pisolithus thermaeus]
MPSKGIFQLDVDSDIWQDVGLGECHPDPPQWLADESEWFSVEWLSIQNALEEADKHYKYHLKTHRDNLVAVYAKWEARVRHIPCAWMPSRPWGPTGEDMANHLATLYDPSVMPAAEEPIDELLEDYSSEWGGVVSEEDDELLTAIEEMALVEEYHIGQADEEFSEDEGWLNDIENGYLPSSPVQLPSKRCRY